MAKDFSKKFYNSKAWNRFRKAYITSRQVEDGGLCEVCRKRPAIILHHMILLNEKNINNADVTLDNDEVVFVCERCHHVIHERDKGIISTPITFDEDGEPIDISKFITR